MIKHLILCVLTAIAAFPQAQTPLTITQSAGSATGEIRLQERRTNGQNYVGLKAPQSVATNTTWTLPDADGTSGQCLDTNGSGILAWHTCSGERMVSDYNWSQVVGAVTAGNVITLTFTGTACPAAATDTNYRLRLYETATPTSYELREITGGTCTRGGSGTLVTGAATVSYTNATATSASGGLQEAIFSVADGNSVYARAGLGTYEIYSDVLDESRYLNLICDGAGAFFVAKADNLKMIHSTSSGGPQIRGCSFLNTYSHASVTAIYTNNPSGSVTGTSVVRNTISGMDVCVHLATVNAVREFSYNQISDCTTAAVRIEASGTGGDAGVGLIGPGNTFLGNATIYGVEWRGPGNLKLHGNSFNGFVEQFHGELKMGVVNVSGTTVTRVSGTPFTASMIGYAFVANDATNSVASTISAWTSSSVMTLTSNSVTCTGCSYYVGVSGQLQIIGNTFDGGSNTTHSVRLSGHIPFFNFHIDDNFMTAYTVSNFKGITVEGRGWYHGHVVSNKIPTSTTGTTIGVDVSGGTAIDVNGNQCVNNLTCVNIGSSANQVTTHHNQCATVYTNNCVLSTSSTSIVHEIAPVTFAQLGALTVADSSTLYCSDCKATSAVDQTCAGSGTGANASRLNGLWKCYDGASSSAFIQGGNSFSADGVLGTNDSHQLVFKTNNDYQWYITTAGHWFAATNNTRDIGGGIFANSPRNIYAATSMVSPAFSAIDSSGSYVRARKLEVHMDGTGTAFFSWSFGTSNTLDLLDTASGVIQRWDRNTSDVSFDAHVWPRGTTETRNLGLTTARWLAVNAKNLNLSGNVTSNLTPSGTRDLGGTGAEWNGLYAGSAVITSIIEPKVNGGAQNGDSAKRWSNVYTVDLNVSGTCTGCSGLPVVDTTTVIKGSADATKLVRFEVDGLTTGTTRVLTVPDTNMTLAGRDVANTWTAAQTYNSTVSYASTISSGLSPTTTLAYDMGSGALQWATIYTGNITASLTGTFGTLVVNSRTLTPQAANYTLAGTNLSQTFSNTQTFSGTLAVSGTIGDDFIPSSDGTFVNGTNSFRWGSIATYNADFNGVLTLQSGSTITGAILPTTNNLYALGNTSFRWSTIVTTNANISGTITAPSGSTGVSATKTVRDSAGTGTCTLIFSGGLLTGGTC